VLLSSLPPFRFDPLYPQHADVTLFRGDDLSLSFQLDDGGLPPQPKNLTQWQEVTWVFGSDLEDHFGAPLLSATIPGALPAGILLEVTAPPTEGIIRLDAAGVLFEALPSGWYADALRVTDSNGRRRVAARGLILLA
jgi:hypothetical protein